MDKLDQLAKIDEDALFVCQDCGYTTVDKEEKKIKKCPQCGGDLMPEEEELGEEEEDSAKESW